MVFSSITFVFFFLPIVLLVYTFSPKAGKNLVLLGASLLFYTWGGGPFLLLLLASIVANYLLGLLVAPAVGRPDMRLRRRLGITLSVLVNIAVLGWFKYANFFVDQINAAGENFIDGFGGFTILDIALPIGVSFYTFQAMSYVIDVATERAKPLYNPFDFALYVALFPQLIAGPIVRYHEISEQLHDRRYSWHNVSAGLLRFALGLMKKVVIADSVAPVADLAFGSPGELTFTAAWIGALAYTVQIYFDFSGYSDMAIGMGRMFGFRFPENFRRPYTAVSVTDFWRRWHITLSSWFRDYVYIPLGGSRGGAMSTYRNLLLVFFITGLWHGAAWSFVAWGMYHGAWLVFERLTGLREARRFVGLRRFITLIIAVFGWVPFRAETLADAWSIWLAMVGLGASAESALGPLHLRVPSDHVLILIGALIVSAWPARNTAGQWLDSPAGADKPWPRLALTCVGLPLAIVYIVSGEFSPFLYFRF